MQHPHKARQRSGSKDFKVRVCNPKGKFLAGGLGGWIFTSDRRRALILNYRRDSVRRYLRLIHRLGGPSLKAVPVDPCEVLEKCDFCTSRFEASKMFFDGRDYRCPACRTGISKVDGGE